MTAVPEPAVLAVAELAERIGALPGVTRLVADERSGAPEVSWGDRFFYVGDDRRRPFATIVEHDVPGFDELSRLDRPGVYRLNVQLGRAEFERRFGYPPTELPQHLTRYDFTEPGVVLPHPCYGTYGWGCVVSPDRAALPEVDRLVGHAHRRVYGRTRRTHDGDGATP